MKLDTHFANDVFWSDASYFSVEGLGSFIHPFQIGHTPFALANHSRVGSQWVINDTPNIPISQRYYLGGRTTVRGFRENSLGPRGSDDAIIGGDLLLQNNVEFRYFAAPSTSVHLFLDAGSVFLQDRPFDSSNIRTSTGVGLRYLSPIGPIGFDVGHPLDEKSGEPSLRFHFQIGATF